jgi:branched-chain amino acid transport system permease protein
MPLLLVFLMLYRPRGIMGLRELRGFIPRYELTANKLWRKKRLARAQEEAGDASAS